MPYMWIVLLILLGCFYMYARHIIMNRTVKEIKSVMDNSAPSQSDMRVGHHGTVHGVETLKAVRRVQQDRIRRRQRRRALALEMCE